MGVTTKIIVKRVETLGMVGYVTAMPIDKEK